MTATPAAALAAIVGLVFNLITGLTNVPRIGAAATWLLKALAVARKIIHFLSVVTHADEEGTFKLPLTKGNTADTSKIGTLILLAFLPVAVTASCAWFTSTAKKAGAVLIDCGEKALAEEVTNLLPAVVAILTGNAADWSAQLMALEWVGEHAVACAVKEFVPGQAPTPPDAGPGPSKASPTPAAERAQAYISGRGWRFK